MTIQKKDPFFSIIMPAYNSERYIRQSIESVQKQTFANWELIIINDYSTDQTVQIVNDFIKNDSRILLYSPDHKRKKAGLARQFGILKARGKYICFLDSDDLYKENKLQHHFGFLEKKPNIDMISTAWDVIDSKGSFISTRKRPWFQKFYFTFLSIRNICLLTNPICTSSCIVKKDLLDKYDFSLYTTKIAEDWLMWNDLFHTHRPNYHYFEMPFTSYRVNSTSLTNQSSMNINYYGIAIFSILLSAYKINFFQWAVAVGLRLIRNLITRKSMRL